MYAVGASRRRKNGIVVDNGELIASSRRGGEERGGVNKLTSASFLYSELDQACARGKEIRRYLQQIIGKTVDNRV